MPPLTGAAEQRAATLLAAAITNHLSSSDTSTVLTGFQTGGLLTASAAFAPRSTVLFLSGPGRQASPALTALAQALAHAGRALVVAGGGSVSVNAELMALRNGGGAKLSTVDDAHTPGGRAAVILALQAGRTGIVSAYGVWPGAQAPLPTPVPTNTPSPSLTPSGGARCCWPTPRSGRYLARARARSTSARRWSQRSWPPPTC